MTHSADHVDIPAGLDLHLDALVAGRELGLNLTQQLRRGVLDADRNTARNLAPSASADMLPERLAAEAGLEIPHGRFEPAARHVVAADGCEKQRNLVRVLERDIENTRDDEVAQQKPGGVGPFLVVEGVLARCDFAPA